MIYYLLLTTVLAIGALGIAVRRRSVFPGQAMLVAGCAGAVACIVWQVRHTVLQPAADGPDRGQAVVGYFLANHVLAEVGNKSGTVMLFFPPTSVFDDEAVGTYAGTFGRVLRSFPDLKVKVVTLAVPAKAAKAGHFPLVSFEQQLSSTPAPVAYVSFAGLPPDIENLGPAVPQGGPAWFAFDPWGTTNWFSALRKSCVRYVVVPRPGIDHNGRDISGEPNEVFHQLYLEATPETADQIAAALGIK